MDSKSWVRRFMTQEQIDDMEDKFYNITHAANCLQEALNELDEAGFNYDRCPIEDLIDDVMKLANEQEETISAWNERGD